MKKTLIAVALSSAFVSVAHAQSSVTLYGLIDAGITYVNNTQYSNSANGRSSGNNWSVGSGNVNESRWGLRGVEDLGGGLKGLFVLENGFNIANGRFSQAGRQFSRQAYIGLASNQFGQVSLGRQYDSVVDFLGPLALTGTQYGGTFMAHPYDNDNLNNNFRINNSIKYTSMNYSGFKFGGMYGFSNKGGGFSDNRAYSLGASYNYAGLNVGAAYLQINNRDNGSGAVDDGVYNGSVSVLGNNINLPTTIGRQRTWGAGLNYAFGPAIVGAVFTQSKLDNTNSFGGNINSGNHRFNNYELNGRYKLTPAWTVAGQYTFTDARLEQTGVAGSAKPRFHTFGLLTSYALSKRTDVYALAAYQRATGDATNASIGAPGNAAGVSSTNKQVVVSTGVRHRF